MRKLDTQPDTTLLALLLLANTASSQVLLSRAAAPGTNSVRSVMASGSVAHVSEFESSIQSTWNVANPFAPFATSPEFDTGFGGRINDAHVHSGPERTFVSKRTASVA